MGVNICARCGRTFPDGATCACVAGGGSQPAPGPDARTSARPSSQTIDVRPFFKLPQPERFEGTVRNALTADALPSDRPAWARALEALGYLPIVVAIVWIGAMVAALRFIAAIVLRRGGHVGSLFGTARNGVALVDRLRRGRPRRQIAAFEVDTPGGSRMVRAALDPATLNLSTGDAVVVFARGRSGAADLATRVEVPRRNASYPVTVVSGGVVAGAITAVFLAMVLLSVMAAQ